MRPDFLIFLRFFLALALFTFSHSSEADDLLDELEIKLAMAANDEKVAVLHEISDYQLQLNPSEALAYAEKALELSKKNQDIQGRIISLRKIGHAQHLLLSDYDKTLTYYFRALQLAEEHNIECDQALTLEAIADVYDEVRNYEQALQHYLKAINLANKKDKGHLLNSIGTAYSHLGNHQQALAYHQKALLVEAGTGNKEGETKSMDFIASAYLSLEDYDRALELYKSALKMRREGGDLIGESQSLHNAGAVYRLKKNYPRALENLELAARGRLSINDKPGLAETYNLMGQVYVDQNNMPEAIQRFSKGLEYAVAANRKISIRKSYKDLSNCYTAIGDYKKALEYQGFYLAIHEFIDSEENDKVVSNIQSKYEARKKQGEIDLLKRDKIIQEMQMSRDDNLKIFMALALFLAITIIMLIWYAYRLKQKANQSLQITNRQVTIKNSSLKEDNETKDKFFSIIAHDLKGPLNSLTSFCDVLINHTSRLSEAEIQLLAKDLDKSVKNLFNFLENLLEWARSQTGNLDYKAEIIKLQELVVNNQQLLQQLADNKNIELAAHLPADLRVKADKNSVNTVIRNLISNAIKFTRPGGKIWIEALEMRDTVMVSIKDNGVGMSPETIGKIFKVDKKHTTKGTSNEKGTGLGLVLCKEFIEKNGGKITVESKEKIGSTFRITLPKAS